VEGHQRDGIQEAGEPGLAGVTVSLYAPDGTTLLARAVTDAAGDYYFSSGSGTNTASAIYGISSLQPNTTGYIVRLDKAADYATGGALAGLVPTQANAGSDPSVNSKGQLVGGFDQATFNTAGVGASDHTHDFGFTTPAGLSGYVYVDANKNGVKDAGDGAVAGVAITLKDAGGSTVVSTTTAGDGSYSFTGLTPGTYSVFEGATPLYAEATNNVGTVNGGPSGTAPAGKDEIDNVQLGPGQSGTNYDFGEQTGSLAGTVYVDVNQNGVLDGGDTRLSGVQVTLTGTDLNGNALASQTTTTDASGNYAFTGLVNGTYTITEAATPLYAEASNTPGTLGGSVSGDTISGISLAGNNDTGSGYKFGEQTGGLAGTVYVDVNKNGVLDGGDKRLSGVQVTLTGTDINGKALASQTTTTDASGNYAFSGLVNGTYAVTEAATPLYAEATNTPGTRGGIVSGDVISGISLAGNSDTGTGYNFGEQTGSLAGTVYVDVNKNGVLDGGDTRLANVQMTLTGTDVNGNALASQTTTTDASGNYSFTGLVNGSYTLTEAATPLYAEATNTPSTLGGTVAGDTITGIGLAGNADNGSGYNFGEQGGSLAGFVYVDANDNGVKDPGETSIPGVTLTLMGTDNRGNPILLTTTAAPDGSYRFVGLPAGSFKVTETQPPGIFDGKNAVGTVNGKPDGSLASPIADVISNITLAAGDDSINNYFGELLPASLSGVVFTDLNGNGVQDPGDPGLGGVVMTLQGTDDLGDPVNLTVTTGPDGSYHFDNLRPGNYALTETRPTGFINGQNAIGSQGGSANGSKFTISVISGVTGVSNNFGNLAIGDVPGFASAVVIPPVSAPPTDPTAVGKAYLLDSGLTSGPNGALANQVRFVNGLYHNLLGRAPDVAGVNAWVSLLQAGISRSYVAEAIYVSPEHRGLQVDRFYQTFFHRNADPAGRSAFVLYFLAGASETDVARTFLTSAEYQAGHPSDGAFVTGLYTDVLGRAPDPTGLAQGQQFLQQSGGQATLAQSFLTSAEADTNVLDSYYANYLNRTPDPQGQAALLALLVSGHTSQEKIAVAFLASDEYFNGTH
jgi:protocatechuate 3,4-dioxygenase beta subunit